MSNMSYCRWENTYRDLAECLLFDGEKLSETEEHFRRMIFELICDKFYLDLDYEEWLRLNDWGTNEVEDDDCNEDEDE